MPPNNRNRAPRWRMRTDLEGRYGRIGIQAVEAAARYSSDRTRIHRSNKDADGGAANKKAPEGLILKPRSSR
jgi:hypothetical protein